MNVTFIQTGFALLVLLVVACGDGQEGPAAVVDTPASQSAATVSPQQEDQRHIDEAIAGYLAENFPDAPSYKGDCETEPEATCGQFRGLDSAGQEYFLLGDPGSLESLAWLVLVRADSQEWRVVDHDLSRGWSRGDTAAIVAGPCQEVRAEPDPAAMALECLQPATPVTISGGPRYDGELFFPIGEGRWVAGSGLCSPREDEGCAASS